jgi:hypothetical protein
MCCMLFACSNYKTKKDMISCKFTNGIFALQKQLEGCYQGHNLDKK